MPDSVRADIEAFAELLGRVPGCSRSAPAAGATRG